jgi:hypothetical protein
MIETSFLLKTKAYTIPAIIIIAENAETRKRMFLHEK